MEHKESDSTGLLEFWFVGDADFGSAFGLDFDDESGLEVLRIEFVFPLGDADLDRLWFRFVGDVGSDTQ